MHSFRLADEYIPRWLKRHPILVHRCSVGDVTEGAMELLFVISLFPLPRDQHDLVVQRFQTDSRTSTLVIWTNTKSRVRYPYLTGFTRTPTRSGACLITRLRLQTAKFVRERRVNCCAAREFGSWYVLWADGTCMASMSEGTNRSLFQEESIMRVRLSSMLEDSLSMRT